MSKELIADIVTISLALGIIALIITIIKYPKDIAKGFALVLAAPLYGLWERLLVLLLPLELLIHFISRLLLSIKKRLSKRRKRHKNT